MWPMGFLIRNIERCVMPEPCSQHVFRGSNNKDLCTQRYTDLKSSPGLCLCRWKAGGRDQGRPPPQRHTQCEQHRDFPAGVEPTPCCLPQMRHPQSSITMGVSPRLPPTDSHVKPSSLTQRPRKVQIQVVIRHTRYYGLFINIALKEMIKKYSPKTPSLDYPSRLGKNYSTIKARRNVF